ncbi:MAG TPA: BrnA antitoxin family protein [Roseiflexaceae bacterium]|nr:BrnA antitoxin family protein [Roseiflexaceae bacterium]
MTDEMQPEHDFSRGRCGAIVPAPCGKTRITIRLDDDILAWFRERAEQAGGGNYQRAINQALREHIERQSLEDLLRRIVREELRNVASHTRKTGQQARPPNKA